MYGVAVQGRDCLALVRQGIFYGNSERFFGLTGTLWERLGTIMMMYPSGGCKQQ
jgi:hypothetical protein